MNRWLLLGRLRAILVLERLAQCFYPRDSVQAAEWDARRQMQQKHGRFFSLIDRTYNLVVRFGFQFHDRELKSLTMREQATLLLFGRIANALRRIQEDAKNAYGPDACGQAASLFEFCWIAAHLSGDEQAASEWLTKKWRSEGADVRKTIAQFLKRHSIQNQRINKNEYEVYRRLNAFKHASRAWLSFHNPRDWPDEGTLRIGPDLSPHGQWALCFSLEASSQLVLMALREASSQLLSDSLRQKFICDVDAANQMRLKLHSEMQNMWNAGS